MRIEFIELTKSQIKEENLLYRYNNILNIASNIVKRLIKKDNSIKLNLSFNDKQVTNKLNTDGLQTLDELMVVMGEVLLTESEIYYKNILSLIKEKTSRKKSFRSYLKKLNKQILQINNHNHFNLKINSEYKSPETCYVYILKNILLSDDIHANKIEQELNTKIYGKIVLFHSQTFALSMFQILFKFNKILKKESIIPKEVLRLNRCIYCGIENGSFKIKEHPFPQSLGNGTSILPRGWCCDECNNNFAIFEEKAEKLIPFSIGKVFYSPFTKQGKFSTATFQNVKVSKNRPNKINFRVYESEKKFQNRIKKGKEGISITHEFISQKIDYKIITKLLLKFALAGIALEKGRNYALKKKFDNLRNFVINDIPFSGVLLIKKESNEPSMRGEIQYHGKEYYAKFKYFGFNFVFSLIPIKITEKIQRLENTYIIWNYMTNEIMK